MFQTKVIHKPTNVNIGMVLLSNAIVITSCHAFFSKWFSTFITAQKFGITFPI